MNDPTRSDEKRLNTRRMILWGAIALGIFGAYQFTLNLLAPDGAVVAPEDGQRAEQTGSAAGTVRAFAPGDLRNAAPSPWSAPTYLEERDLADARALLANLLQASDGDRNITEEEAEELNRYLAQLALLGPNGVDAIREYLASGDDIKFKDMHGGKQVNYPSLRAALIEALGRIGGPEAIEALVETLAVTAEPVEIAALAQALERQAPGVYRGALLTAARESLQVAADAITQARSRSPADREAVDVSPLYEVMRALGNTDLLKEMLEETEGSLPPWKIYSMIGLAQMPGGEGVEALREALETEDGRVAKQNLFGLQMLGQAAVTQPGAAEALLDFAEAHGQELSTRDWRKLAWTLRGHYYDFGGALDTGSSRGNVGMDVTMHSLNLHLRREVSDPATWTRDQVDRQVNLIDELLATDPPPEAAYELERTRDWILRRSGVVVTSRML